MGQRQHSVIIGSFLAARALTSWRVTAVLLLLQLQLQVVRSALLVPICVWYRATMSSAFRLCTLSFTFCSLLIRLLGVSLQKLIPGKGGAVIAAAAAVAARARRAVDLQQRAEEGQISRVARVDLGPAQLLQLSDAAPLSLVALDAVLDLDDEAAGAWPTLVSGVLRCLLARRVVRVLQAHLGFSRVCMNGFFVFLGIAEEVQAVPVVRPVLTGLGLAGRRSHAATGAGAGARP